MSPSKNIDAVDPHRPVEDGLPLFSKASRDEQARQMGRHVEDFKAEKLARKTDPETSKLAAKAAGSLVINHQRLIIEAVSEESAKNNMGLTPEEIGGATGLTSVQVTRRVKDLSDAKVIYDSGLTRKHRNGRSATVWRLAGH